MFPTAVRLSKASRRPLTGKRGPKDYYKGTRQAFLPGGLRTGAPGKYFGKSQASYRLVDEQVRYFVAPPIEDIVNSPLKAYVSAKVRLNEDQLAETPFGRIPTGGLRGTHYLAHSPSESAPTHVPAELSTSADPL